MLHLAALLNGPIEDSLNREVRSGGYIGTAFTYYARGSGPVLEEDMPFKNHENAISQSDLPIDRNIQKVDDMIYFPQIYKKYFGRYTDANNVEYSEQTVNEIREEIKKHIMENGGVVTSIYAANDTGYYNTETNAAYLYHEFNANHDVLIIGWDDNYSRDNFLSKPKKDGAYIVLNSWGEEWGDNGIYYVSYEDFLIESNVRGITKASDINYDNIYQYDTNEVYNFIKSKYAANIFTANKNETLAEIMVGSLSDQICNIYINGSNDNLNINNLNAVKNNVKLKPGFNTIEINPNIELKEGNKFAIIIEVLDDNLGIGVEDSTSYFARVTSNQGESFKSSDGVHWQDIYDENNMMNFSIKAFTTEKEKFGEIKDIKYSTQNIIEGIGGNAYIYLKTSTLLENTNPVIKIYKEEIEVTDYFNIQVPIIKSTLCKIDINISKQTEDGEYIIKIFDNLTQIAEGHFIILDESIFNDEFIKIRFPDLNLYNALKEKNVLENSNVLAYFDDTQEMILNINISTLDLEGGTYSAQDGQPFFGTGYNITNIDGLENLAYLSDLNLSANNINSIGKLKDLQNLNYFNLSYNKTKVEDIEIIKNWNNLIKLAVPNTDLDDISFLINSPNLYWLSIENTKVKDISVLENCEELYLLSMSFCKVNNLGALKNLKKLEWLYAMNCGLKSIDDLQELTNLYVLYVDGNEIQDISKLNKLSNLYQVFMDSNQISDISVVSNWKNLDCISLSGNNISDITSLETLTNLRLLYLVGNKIEDFTVLDRMNNYFDNLFCWEQNISKTYNNETKIIEIPKIFQQAMDQESQIYSNDGLELNNCTWNEFGKNIKINDECDECSVIILNGAAWGTRWNVTIDDTQIIGGDIQNINISDSDVSWKEEYSSEYPEFTYDTTEKRPEVIVNVEGKELQEGKDYTVKYLNNINAGTATVTIEATEGGKYIGVVTKEFIIKKAERTITMEQTKSILYGRKCTIEFEYDGDLSTVNLINSNEDVITVSVSENDNLLSGIINIVSKNLGKSILTLTVAETSNYFAKSIECEINVENVTSEKYRVNEQFIEKVEPKTKLAEFISNFDTYGLKIKILNGDYEISESDIIGTGYIIQFGNELSYKIIVQGDCDGDGQADIKDIVKINNFRLYNTTTNFGEAYKIAGDINKDNKIDIKDMIMINNYRLYGTKF